MALQAVSLFWEPCFFRHEIISGSFFHEYLAKPCLSSKIIGRTVLASSSLCLVDEPTLNNRDRLKREADASAQRVREHSSKHRYFLDSCVNFLVPKPVYTGKSREKAEVVRRFSSENLLCQ